MSDRREAILDVAEQLIRAKGYQGFSFREVAEFVAIKSASVHYYFPTKPDLAVAVARRYRMRFESALDAAEQQGTDRISAWRTLFQKALERDGLMCLCGILAVEGNGLPAEVAQAARSFLQFGIASLDRADPGQGARIMAELEGAMLIARSMNDPRLFTDITAHLGQG
ncbi:MAG: TetR/AcrR family transcriptional regulator [Pseudomonadota bacterium]